VQDLRAGLAAMVSRPMVIATGFVAVPSLMFGAVEVLVPLRIDDLGGSSTLIAAAFVVTAGIEATLAPISGRYSDRAGRRIPFVAGISVCCAALLGLAAAPETGTVIAALFLTAVGAGLCFTPAITALTEAGESARLHEGFAAGLSNVAWASGQVLGAVAGGSLASAAGFAVPYLAIAALMGATAVFASRALRGGYAAPVPSGAGDR
jgi:MFS family permease